MSGTIDYGIDLGTTNSSIALCRRGEVRIFQTTDLMNVTPSVVYVSKSGRMLVGKKAYDAWTADPQNTQAEFKRWMGYSDRLTFPASGRQFSAEELSAEVLKSVRADAERQTQEQITAAVITVPAAFGSLQCDATARAARMAGIEQCPLLPEPVAVAVAYGATPTSHNQRCMVFDLGGGTLDIAIVSTRDGRLAVLEHQGNNRLGGKDIDQLVAEAFLLAPLAQTFRLPTAQSDPLAHRKLMRAMIRHAEQAKIVLSTTAETTVDLLDVGEDLDGKPIEATITIKRADMEARVTPVFDRCIELARRALDGARLASSDLERVLLVGGPTQMPALRDALGAALGVKLDHFLDPMTVVSHGAALYASTIERTQSQPAPAPAKAPKAPADAPVAIQLSYERASGTLMSPVVGVVDSASGVHEVKIDSVGGNWSSGWVALSDGCFQAEVKLLDTRPVTRFTLVARGTNGQAIRVEPPEFSITFMLPMAAQPLPHAVAIELSTTHGVTNYDPVFRRNAPLPAETRKIYKADRTLRPSDFNSSLPIKFWEIDVSDDPQERWWAGCVHIRADRIKRPILEGTEMELTIKIDTSRKMSVSVSIPLLQQTMAHDVYIPDPPGARSQMQQQLDLCFERLEHIRMTLFETGRHELTQRLEQLQISAETIAEQVGSSTSADMDPDAALAPTDVLRRLRIQLTQLEEQLNIGSAAPTLDRKLRYEMPYLDRIVHRHGTEIEQREFDKLAEQYQRCVESNDSRGLKWVHGQLWSLHSALVRDQMWFWQDILEYLKNPGRRFLNRDEAAKAIVAADAANASGNLPALRNACNRAWAMQPADQLETAMEQAAQSGLRSS